MKFAERGCYADPDIAARKLGEIANDVEAVQDGRLFIERVNAPFLAAVIIRFSQRPCEAAQGTAGAGKELPGYGGEKGAKDD